MSWKPMRELMRQIYFHVLNRKYECKFVKCTILCELSPKIKSVINIRNMNSIGSVPFHFDWRNYHFESIATASKRRFENEKNVINDDVSNPDRMIPVCHLWEQSFLFIQLLAAVTFKRTVCETRHYRCPLSKLGYHTDIP